MKINPRNYDHLWSNQSIDFFFISYWLNKEYRNRNTLIIFDCKKHETKYFLSKRSMYHLSRFGLIFFKKLFSQWKKDIEKKFIEARGVIKEVKEKDFFLLSDFELKEDFLSKVSFYQSLGQLYFFTEFFLLDEVERKIKENPKKCKKLFKNVNEMQKVKFQAREIINKFWFKEGVFKYYIDEIQKRIGRKDLGWLHYNEIVKILEGKNIKKSNRDQKDWIFTKLNNWNLITGRQASEILKDFDDYFFNKKVKTIKGNIANPGVYMGKVKIIRTIFGKQIKEEINKIKKGDILVAGTTGPELMLACQKAGAIVTNAGGITSHAAIVSRELGTPCIIGTKIATKVLKDGDLVEVDADKGIVKVIKRVNFNK